MIDTERLTLIPLTARQLKLWLDNQEVLEDELKCKYFAEPLDGVFRDIVQGQIVKSETDASNYIYHSFWWIIRKDDGNVVGSCGFKNVPNENCEVEIGYGLGKEFEGFGFMTEAVEALCSWGLKQNKVRYIIAETEKDNPKSENVLKRVGFVMYEQRDTNWWKL